MRGGCLRTDGLAWGGCALFADFPHMTTEIEGLSLEDGR